SKPPKLIVETTGGSDATAPSAPAGLAVTSSSASSLAFAWSPSTDDTAVAGYDVFLNGTKAAITKSTVYSLDGPACGTSYTLAIEAFDAVGNRPTRSSLSASTAACPDS